MANDDTPQPGTVEERLATLEEKIEGLRNQLIAQEHRGLSAVANIAKALLQPDRKGRSRAAKMWRGRLMSAVRGLFGAMRPTPTKTFVVLGGTFVGMATLLVMIGANRLMQHQTQQMLVQNHLGEAQRRAALMFEFSEALNGIADVESQIAAKAPTGNPRGSLAARRTIVHGRIKGLSAALKPYRYLRDDLNEQDVQDWWVATWNESWFCTVESAWFLTGFRLSLCETLRPAWNVAWATVSLPDPEDILTKERLSPERGQLAISLSRAKIPIEWRALDLGRADLASARLYGADMEGAYLPAANLTDAYLYSAKLVEALLDEANLARAHMADANLTAASLREAKLADAYLIGAELISADLTRADLTGANLIDADLTRADLTGADLTGANLTGADLTGANLTGANLNGASLLAVTIRAADLTRSTITQHQLDQTCLGIPEAPPRFRYSHLDRVLSLPMLGCDQSAMLNKKLSGGVVPPWRSHISTRFRGVNSKYFHFR